MSLYRDGNLISSETTYENLKPNSNCNVYIGGVKTGGGGECQFTTSQSFSGLMDEASLWSSALTKEQIKANMKTIFNSPTSNLAAYYSFENGTGVDESGNKLNGEVGPGIVRIFMKAATPFGVNGKNKRR